MAVTIENTTMQQQHDERGPSLDDSSQLNTKEPQLVVESSCKIVSAHSFETDSSSESALE